MSVNILSFMVEPFEKYLRKYVTMTWLEG